MNLTPPESVRKLQLAMDARGGSCFARELQMMAWEVVFASLVAAGLVYWPLVWWSIEAFFVSPDKTVVDSTEGLPPVSILVTVHGPGKKGTGP